MPRFISRRIFELNVARTHSRSLFTLLLKYSISPSCSHPDEFKYEVTNTQLRKLILDFDSGYREVILSSSELDFLRI